MDLSKVLIQKSEFKDQNSEVPIHYFFTEVAFLEKTPMGTVVYQLKKNILNDFMLYSKFSIDQESYIKLGFLFEIDFHRKTIRLIDQNLLSFRYLIISKNFGKLTFSAGLSTLKEVLFLESLNLKQKLFYLTACKECMPSSAKEMSKQQGVYTWDTVGKIWESGLPHTNHSSLSLLEKTIQLVL